MKVSDIMQRDIDYASPSQTVLEASRLIFGHGHHGLPVCEGKEKKIVGFITDQDILSKFFPSMQEYIEDYANIKDFEKMEEKVKEILSMKVQKVMSKNIILIGENEPVLKVQSIMQVKDVGRLPVVDKHKRLIGIVSKGDIFRSLVGKRLFLSKEGGFYDWLSEYYEGMFDWEARLSAEIPSLVSLFRKEGVTKVLDVGCGPGAHVIALAKEGFSVVGIDRTAFMLQNAKAKMKELPDKLKKRITFQIVEDYTALDGKLDAPFDVVMFLGSSFSHPDRKDSIVHINRLLKPGGVLIFQNWNLEKYQEDKDAVFSFMIKESKGYEKRHAFLRFFDKTGGLWSYVVSMLSFDGAKWRSKATDSVPIAQLKKEEMERILRKNGLTKISFFGSTLYGPLFSKPFDPDESVWMNVVVKK